MDGFTHKGWLKASGALFALLVLCSLLTFHPNDPTLTNLRYPSGGIANLLWLPGALLGGTLVEFFGASALWFPLLIGNGLLVDSRKGALRRMVIYGGGLVAFSAAGHGLVDPEPVLGLGGAGLAGLAARGWIAATTGGWAGGAILAWGAGYALWQLVSLSLLGVALRDGRMFLAFFSRAAARRLRLAGEVATEAAGRWREKARRPVPAHAAPQPRPHAPKGNGAAQPGGRTPATPAGGPLGSGPGRAAPGAGEDGFNAWLASLGEAPQGGKTAGKP